MFGRGERRVMPPPLRINGEHPVRTDPFEPLVHRAGRRGTPESHHEIGAQFVEHRRMLEQVLAGGDQGIAVSKPQLCHRLGDDRPPGRSTEVLDRVGETETGLHAWRCVRANEDDAPLDRHEVIEAFRCPVRSR